MNLEPWTPKRHASCRTYTKHGPGSMDRAMDPVHGPPHGPGTWTTPNFQKVIATVDIREIELDVTWSYVKRQTAKMTCEFVFFSSNPSLNHIKIEKCLLLFATNTNIFTLLFKELKADGKSFIFAVCRLT